MAIIEHACSTQLGLILTTGILIFLSSCCQLRQIISLGGQRGIFCIFQRVSKGPLKKVVLRCTFCLSVHVQAIVLINQSFFFKVLLILRCKLISLGPSLSPAAKCSYLIFILTAVWFGFPPEIVESCCHCCTSTCLSAASNKETQQ